MLKLGAIRKKHKAEVILMAKKRTYQVGELASYFNVTRDTIRHYDKIGILHPQEISKSGYRLYTREDFICMEYVMRLKKLGIPLSQIKKLVNDSTIEEAEEMMELQAVEIARQIEELQNMQVMVEDYRISYRRAVELLGKIVVKTVPEMIYIPIKSSLMESMEDITSLTKNYVPKFTFVMNSVVFEEKQYIDLLNAENRQNYFDYAVTLENELGLEEVPENLTDRMGIRPECKCIYSVIKIDTGKNYDEFEKCRNYIIDNGYKLRGDVHLRLIFLSAYNEAYYEFVAPVE